MKRLKLLLRQRLNHWVINYVERQFLSEIHEVSTGRFIRVYPNYEAYNAASWGVFDRTMKRYRYAQ